MGAGVARIHLNGAAFGRAVANLTVRGRKGRARRPVVYANAKTHHGHPRGGAYHTAGVGDGGARNGQERAPGAGDGASAHPWEDELNATGMHVVAASADRIRAVHLRKTGTPPAAARGAEVAAVLEARIWRAHGVGQGAGERFAVTEVIFLEQGVSTVGTSPVVRVFGGWVNRHEASVQVVRPWCAC